MQKASIVAKKGFLPTLTERQKGILSACLGVLFLSPDTLLIRLSSPPCPPNEMMFWRFAISVCSLLVMTTIVTAYGRHYNSFKNEHSETYLFIDVMRKFTSMSRWMVLSAIFYAFGNLFFMWALQLTFTASVLVVMATSAIFGAIFSYFLLHEHMPLHTIICCLTCISAIILIFFQ